MVMPAKVAQSVTLERRRSPAVAGLPPSPRRLTFRRAGGALGLVAHMVLVLFWSPIRWAISLSAVYHACRTVYYWETPGVGAGWDFLLHFGVLTALTWLVAFYNPRKRR